jgi:hypothetical protein
VDLRETAASAAALATPRRVSVLRFGSRRAGPLAARLSLLALVALSLRGSLQRFLLAALALLLVVPGAILAVFDVLPGVKFNLLGPRFGAVALCL